MTIFETRRNQVFNRDGTLASEEVVDVDVTAPTNLATLRQQAEAALVTLQAQIDQPPVTVTTLAQAQAVCRGLQQAVQFQAQVDRRLIRLALGLLDGTT